MKARKICFFEVEKKFKKVLIELERMPRDEGLIIEYALESLFCLGVCISQMKADNAIPNPGKRKHLGILQNAQEAITYKLNICTIEEVEVQVNNAYMAFGLQ